MHVRFDDGSEGCGQQAAVEFPTAPRAASFASGPGFQCLASVRTDFDKDQCYVFELAHCPATGLVAAALSNRRIKLFNFNEGGLQFVGDLLGHEGSIRALHFPLPADQPHLLHSCSADGTLRGWDVRSGLQVESYNAPRLELLSCTTNGTLVAAGGGDKILFWDRRTQRPVASFDDTHAQDVTQVAFHPARTNMLVSGSEDGLIAVFDTSPQLDEDEGFQAALNIDTSVAQLGFYGAAAPGGERLWARSGVESLHLWEWGAACNDEAQGGNGALAEALDARLQLSAAAASCAVGQALAPGLDYLVGCEYNAAANQLWLLAGTSGGAVGFFPVVEPPLQPAACSDDILQQHVQQGPPPAQRPSLFAQPQAVLAGGGGGGGGGHSDVVRSVLWPGAAGSMCLSGGEDSKMCVWGLNHRAAAAGASSSQQHQAPPPRSGATVGSGSSGGGSGAVRKQRDHAGHRQQQQLRGGTPY